MPRKCKSLLPRLRRWRQSARWARRKLARAPRAVRIAGVVAILLAVVALTNLVYQVIHKPTELFVFVGHRLDKEPAETWRQYGALFRTYSTATITPELLAALAQVESSGQSGGAHLLALAMELQSFRDLPARLQRRRPLPDDRCGLRRGRAVLYPGERGHGYRLRVHRPYIRAIPSHAIELASVYLDRNVAEVLARARCDAQARSRSRISPPSSISAARVPPRLSRAAIFR